jgi:hypothetical protein
VIRLRFFEDLPPTRIAERLGEPLETIRTCLERALRNVQALLAKSKGARRRPSILRRASQLERVASSRARARARD